MRFHRVEIFVDIGVVEFDGSEVTASGK